MNEYRPRLRANRKSKITRKDNLIIVACDSAEEAARVEAAIVYATKFPDPIADAVPEARDALERAALSQLLGE